MSPLEMIVLVLGIPFFFIEISQLIQLVRSQKKLTSIWERVLDEPEYAGAVLGNAIIGILDKLEDEPELDERLFQFVGKAGIVAASNVKVWLSSSDAAADVRTEAIKQKTKGLPKWMKDIIKGADAIGIDIGGIAEKRGKKAVSDAVDSIIPTYQ